MPKKKSTKKKKTVNDEVSKGQQEELPQVWLTVKPGQGDEELRAIGSQADIIEAKPVSMQTYLIIIYLMLL